ncbi:MAG: lasso peptide biosynthesis B2 protein [Atribacterota bacterium]
MNPSEEGHPVLSIKVFFLLIFYSFWLKVLSFPALVEKTERFRNRSVDSHLPPDTVLLILENIWRECTFILRTLLRSPKPCLRRSLVLYHWCCMNGIDAQLVIGVKKVSSRPVSHAWIILQGHPLHEDEGELSSYTPFLTVPSGRGDQNAG